MGGAVATNTTHKPRLGLLNRMSRFATAGAANALLTFLLYNFLLLATPYWLAYTLSFVAGIGFATLVNPKFVFDIDLGLAGAIRFSLFYLASYGIGLKLLSVLIQVVGFPA